MEKTIMKKVALWRPSLLKFQHIKHLLQPSARSLKYLRMIIGDA